MRESIKIAEGSTCSIEVAPIPNRPAYLVLRQGDDEVVLHTDWCHELIKAIESIAEGD